MEQSIGGLHASQQLWTPEMEYKEFEPPFKSAKTGFKLAPA